MPTYRPTPAVRRAVNRATEAIITAIYAGTDPRPAVEASIARTRDPRAAAVVRDWVEHGGLEAVEAEMAMLRSATA